jgi:hypothetical protein
LNNSDKPLKLNTPKNRDREKELNNVFLLNSIGLDYLEFTIKNNALKFVAKRVKKEDDMK